MAPLLNYPPVSTIPIGPIHVFTWGIFVALGVLVGTAAAKARARRAGIDDMAIVDLAVWMFVAGIIGARFLFVAEYWRSYIHAPWHVVALWEGGMSMYGSIVFVVIAVWWFCKRRNLSLWDIARVIATPLLLGDAIGRIGGASSHMYPGTPTTFPLSYMLDGIQRHEVGIELALVSLLGYASVRLVEIYIAKRIQTPNIQASWRFSPALVVLWYSAERFLMDFLRSYDLPTSDYRYAGLTLAQYFAIAGIAVSAMLFLLALRVVRSAKPENTAA